ncbi:sensor domain-containing protein [Stenotrophomonas sp. CFBP8980]|uniref:sensor domain-containing protein n=1 Tax=Stenotrophomonas sp. CFBP8980 TaxID=3096523 RepID=UPI002A6A0B0F|nr:sensor domain-containing protein [Stenotrophomonas sp. CFBP8980]MDY1034847.1 sensor domain-containing protein [Stenotrophomonas sp. CFBP8980]
MNIEHTMGRTLPATIPDYLAQLRAALHDADPAMVQDALYDAEEYLRSELAAQPGRSEGEVIADVAGSYGAPDEVADIYRETELTVNRALRTPKTQLGTRVPTAPAVGSGFDAVPPAAGAAASGPAIPDPPPSPPRSLAARFFGVVVDPHTYGALFYMLLSLATGTFFFSWVVTGLSLSLGLLILIIGVPVAVLFFGSIRGLSLLEGRLVEALLGERMPRRPRFSDRSRSWLQRIGDMFTDGRTWLTLLYFVLMLPLGIAYFTVATTLLALSLALIWSPVAVWFPGAYTGVTINGLPLLESAWATPLLALAGGLLLFGTLHLARAVGRMHGTLAKHLLVRL